MLGRFGEFGVSIAYPESANPSVFPTNSSMLTLVFFGLPLIFSGGGEVTLTMMTNRVYNHLFPSQSVFQPRNAKSLALF